MQITIRNSSSFKSICPLSLFLIFKPELCKVVTKIIFPEQDLPSETDKKYLERNDKINLLISDWPNDHQI